MLEELKEDFFLGYLVSKTRIELAKMDNVSEEDIMNYLLLRESFERDNATFRESFGGCIGYLVGNYAVFCSSQFKLDIFDEGVKCFDSEFKSLCESLLIK